MFWKKIYPYSKYGIFDGYDVPMSQLGWNFERLLKNEGKCTIRASLETLGMQTFEDWADDATVPIGAALLYISPRGSRTKENYPGFEKENYVFINIFQKIGLNQHQLIQYTSFDGEDALEKLQLDVLKSCTGSSITTHSNQVNTDDLSQSHSIIARKIKLPTCFSIKDIEEKVYEHESSWPTKRKDLPQVDEVQFGFELERLLKFCESAFLTLAHQNHESSEELKPSHLQKFAEFHQEIDGASLPPEKQFDILIACARKEFLKWVQDHSENYHTKSITLQPLALEKIVELWGHECLKETRQLKGKQKSHLRELHESIALDPTLPLMKLSSLAHCIAFTPHSVALNLVKFPQVSWGVGMSAQLLNLSSLEKSDALAELKQHYVQKNLFGQRWYILRTESHEYTELTCILKNGDVIGPCGIPLNEDREFCLSAEAYDQLLSTLSVNSPHTKLTTLQSHFNNSDLTQDEKNHADQFMTFLETLVRHTASLLEFINNDFYSPLANQILALIEELPDPLMIVKSPHFFVKKIAVFLQDIDETLLPLFFSQELRTSPTVKKTV